jgi:hypothetical protein
MLSRDEINRVLGRFARLGVGPLAKVSTPAPKGRTKSPPGKAAPRPRLRTFPCRFEGPVIEPCTAGCPSRAELGHVRHCLCDAVDADAMTRGSNSGKTASGLTLASCTTCAYHQRPDAP